MIADPPVDAHAQGQAIVEKFCALGVPSELIEVIEAPQLIRVLLRPTGAAKMHDYRRLSRADDLAYELGARRVKITAPVPGQSAIAIEFDRADRRTVTLDDLPAAHVPMLVNLGLEVDGSPAILPLVDSPHCLIAGQTGSGKTTCLHTILAQLVSSHTPDELELVLIDPKRVEFAQWESIPHMAAPVADSTQEAISQLRAMTVNMDERYSLLRRLGARDIMQANGILDERYPAAPKIPYMVAIVDELADLMMTSKGEVESLLVRIAQKGRAAGLHLILATQYPKSKVVTGLLRVNLPTKIAFAVPDKVASRVVLDRNGAEELYGRGDGLLSFGGLPAQRFQSAYCSPDEVQDIVTRSKETE